MYEYENVRRVVCGDEVDAEGYTHGATFVPVCPNCGRFVRADAEVWFDGEGQPQEPNGTCARCGRIAMLFEGCY